MSSGVGGFPGGREMDLSNLVGELGTKGVMFRPGF